MKPKPTIRFTKWLCLILACSFSTTVFSQPSICPPNIDFKSGSFANWECTAGTVAAIGGVNTVTLSGTGPLTNRHELIPPDSKELDEYGGFPKHCPNTTSYSVKLGNANNGHEAEGLSYTFTIPASSTKFSLLYYYAIVLQNPNHQVAEQPRFRARVIDAATDTEIDCVSFDFSSSGSLPNFLPTPVGSALYKDWTPVSVDLSSFAGKTVRLEFITSDCTFQAHFGYAYISVSSSCNGSISGNFYCAGDTALSLTAPYGFQQYSWYADASFGQPVSNTQNLALSVSVTAVGAVLPVIVSPYPGYGCLDTLYAIIGSAGKPLSKAGGDVAACSKSIAQLGAPPNPSYTYAWKPAQFLSDPAIADPVTLPGISTPTNFIVKTTDIETGCFSYDTTVVTPIVVDTGSSFTGRIVYCPGERFQTTLQVNNRAAEVQWFNDNLPVRSAVGPSYQPLLAGSYWATIKENGCIDSSRHYVLRYAPLPKAAFNASKEIQCLNYPVAFTNRSVIEGAEPLKYLWRFSDGGSLQTVNADKSFITDGTFRVTLIARSVNDCIDSTTKTVSIVKFCTPALPTAFTPNNDGRNDNLKPYLIGAKGLKRFAIYNRYGNLVFSTTKEGEGWDGSYKGAPLSTDVFVWVLEYESNSGQTVSEKGTVTLIR